MLGGGGRNAAYKRHPQNSRSGDREPVMSSGGSRNSYRKQTQNSRYSDAIGEKVGSVPLSQFSINKHYGNELLAFIC